MKPSERRLASRPASIDDIEETAAAWLARRYGGFSLEDSHAFQTWLAADPRHASAVADLEHAWQVVSSPGAAGQGRIARERQRVRERRRIRHQQRRMALGLASLAVAALVILPVLPERRFDSESPAKSGVTLRPDVQILSDGSRAELNAGAEVVVAFTANQRSVRLVRGEALFNVAADARRPFVVSAGGVEVIAVGTSFNVRFDPHQVAVLVTEGTVAVNRSAAGADDAQTSAAPAMSVAGPIRVTAGQRTAVSLGLESAPTVIPATPAEISAALAWRERRIEFTGTALGEAFTRFNRQNAIQLSAADTHTAEFQISGIFWVDDPESFVRLLDSAFNMGTDRTGQKIVVRKR